MNRRRLLTFLAVVVAAAAVYELTQQQPAKQPPPQPVIGPNGNLLRPESLVTIRCVLAGGGPCSVTVSAHSGPTLDHLTFNLSSGEPRSQPLQGPLTIDSIIVDRNGKVNRQETKINVPAGETREIRVKADDTAEVVKP